MVLHLISPQNISLSYDPRYAFNAITNDPQFVFENPQILSGRKIKLSFFLKTSVNRVTEPKIYWDNGLGMNEENSMVLDISWDGTVDQEIVLPSPLYQLRLDPIAQAGMFSLNKLNIVNLGSDNDFISRFKSNFRYVKNFNKNLSVIQMCKMLAVISTPWIKGVNKKVDIDMHAIRDKAFSNSNLQSDDITSIDDAASFNAFINESVAVQLHVYYLSELKEIQKYLNNIPVQYYLYISTDTNEKSIKIKNFFNNTDQIKYLEVVVTKNRGRDVAPMIVSFGKKLLKHTLVLHLHTKKSPHNPELRGWRTYLLKSLLASQESVAGVFEKFKADSDLGILYPATYFSVLPFMRLGGNSENMHKLLCKSKKNISDFESIDKNNFPSGSMFWFRSEALKPLVDMNLTFDDFDEEAGQDDGTLAHAIERMFIYYARVSGLYSKRFMPSSIFNPILAGTFPLSKQLFAEIIEPSEKVVIIFDHNIGGGTNVYGIDLIEALVLKDINPIRIYYDINIDCWIVQLIAVSDGMYFSTNDLNELFIFLQSLNCKEIIVNSFFAMPDLELVINATIQLSKTLKAPIDYKVHDFYAICPSQHLLNFNLQYCNVPTDKEVCQRCLNCHPDKDLRTFNSDYNISNWRSSYEKLLTSTSKVSVFDHSSVEVLRNVYNISDEKIAVNPHDNHKNIFKKTITVTGQLHVGFIGNFIMVKGASIINSLSSFIEEQSLNIPITVVGHDFVKANSNINVLGSYDVKDLPAIIEMNNITVVFMPSIIPETFCYTISEAMALNIPIISFDIGAQGSRISQYEKGIVIPLDSTPAEILNAIKKAYDTFVN